MSAHPPAADARGIPAQTPEQDPHDRSRWPWWRPPFLVAGVVLLVWCIWGWPGSARAETPWAGALGVAVIAAVVPLVLALGDPVHWWEHHRGRPVAALRGAVARTVMFPLVASVVAAGVLTVAFTSGWFEAARRGQGPWLALVAAALVTGLLVNFPLLTDDLLPAWVGPGMVVVIAAVDGLIDALPGVVTMTTVDWMTGMVLLLVAEAIAIPFLAVVIVRWMRAEDAHTAAVDAELDAEPFDDTPWFLRQQ
ncbi:MAG TPA: cytochrome c oxidase assembly protein [Phycicoccus sp.]|nr:cytochrome c oxidase assembly protein [Phycicoccus sp.]